MSMLTQRVGGWLTGRVEGVSDFPGVSDVGRAGLGTRDQRISETAIGTIFVLAQYCLSYNGFSCSRRPNSACRFLPNLSHLRRISGNSLAASTRPSVGGRPSASGDIHVSGEECSGDTGRSGGADCPTTFGLPVDLTSEVQRRFRGASRAIFGVSALTRVAAPPSVHANGDLGGARAFSSRNLLRGQLEPVTPARMSNVCSGC
jgi:hypothetical protein